MIGKTMKNEEKNTLSKTSKLASVLVTIMMITVVFSVVLIPNVKPTTVTKVDAPAAYVKQSQTNVLVMNFTVTTQTDTVLAGVTPSVGQTLQDNGELSDWGGIGKMLYYKGVSGEWNAASDSIWLDTVEPDGRYTATETVLAGSTPVLNTSYTGVGCKSSTWVRIKTIDASDGGIWNGAADSIIFEGTDNNTVYQDQLKAVTFKLNSSGNATSSDISTLSLWRESNAQTGFQSGDTRLITVTYTAGTSSWNVTGLSANINTTATFYATVNISGSAVHNKRIRMWIPTLSGGGTYDYGDQGLFLAGTNDTGNILNTNYLTIDTFAPVTSADGITGYWKKASHNPLTITATTTDNLSGIASVGLYYFYCNDNSTWTTATLFGTDTSSSYSWNFTFTNGSGYYRFYTRGTDNVNNVESVPLANDTICGYDIFTPSTEISIPASSGNYNTLNNITGTASDTFSGVSSVTITIYNSTNSRYWSGTAWGTSAVNLTTSGTTSWYKSTGHPTWTTSKVYIINSTATDRVGNLQTSVHSHTFTFDTNAPTGSISIPTNPWYKTMTNITGTASDTGGSSLSLSRISIYNSTGGKYYTGTAWSGSLSWITATGTTTWYKGSGLPPWTNGSTYVVNLSLKDNANNYNNASDSNTFSFDTDLPVSQVTAITGYWKTSSPLVIVHTSSENGSGSGLKNVTLYYYYSTTNTTFTGPWMFGVDPDPWITKTFNFTFPNASGFYRFYSLARDNATNVELASVANDTICGYDVVNPTATITLPTDGGYYKAGAAINTNITGTATDTRGVTLVNISIYNSTDSKYWTGSAWQTGSANITTNQTAATPTALWWFNNQTSFPTWLTGKSYTITVRAKDMAGNWNNLAATSTFTYDTTAPAITDITAPINVTWYKALTNVTGTASDAGGLSLVNITIYNSTGHKYWNGTTWSAVVVNITATGTTSWYRNGVSGLPTWANGTTYFVNATPKDLAGNVGTKHSHTFYIDTTAPTSQVTAISGYWKTGSITITATAPAHAGSGLKNVTLYYYYSSTNNQTFTGPTLFSVNSSPWIGVSWSFNFPAGNGYYRFYSRAADNATSSNIETAPVANDTICGYDSAVPFSSVDAITPYWKTTAPITITATAGNNASGVKNVTFYYRYSADNSSFGAWMNNGTDTASPWSRVITFFNGTGYYQFYSRAADNATNTEAAPGITPDARCGYDFTAPTTSVSTISPYWRTTDTTITATVSSNNMSGIDTITLYYRNSTNNNTWSSPWIFGTADTDPWVSAQWTFTFPNGTGYYRFYSRGTDNATNTEALPDVNSPDAFCGYDDVLPSSTVNAISPYWKTATPITITATASDVTSGVKNVTLYYRFSSDNSSWDSNTSVGVDSASPWSWSFNFSTKGDTGYYRFYSIACDNATNTESSPGGLGDTKCGYDFTRPVCTIQYNRSATYFKAGTTLKIWVNFTEATSGINPSSVTMNITTQGLINDTHNTTLTQTNNLHWYKNWVVPSGSNDGAFTVKIYASDNATNLLNPYPTTDNTKKIDNTAPTCTIGYNNSRTYFKAGEAIKIYANFTETGSGMNNASVTIRINTTAGNGNLSNTTMTKTDYTHYYYGWTIPSGTDDSGTFTVRIYAQDNVTNALSPYPTTNNARKIDNTPPTCTIAYNRTSTYFKAGVALKIFANFTEAESGMNDATVKIKINTTAGNGNLTNTTMTKTDATHYYHSWTIPSGSDDDGTFTVRIYAQDNATLYLSPYPTTNSSKIIDNTPPTLSYAVLDADNDGTNYTYVDVYFSETTMDTTTEAYTDFNISESGVGVAAIQNKSGNRVTLRFNTTFQTGDSPTVGITGSVADLAGNTLTSGTKTINTFRTSLKSGLNLISLPADTSTATISTVVSGLSGTVTIWRYNANNDTWSSWVKTVSGDTFRLQPGRGYWFNMGTAGTLTGNYNLWPDPGYAPPSTTLTGQKWNLVGHFQSYNQSASTSYGGALASLSDSDVGSLWRYNTGGGYTNILNGAQDMQPGQGYWLFKESSGDKLYTPS